METANVCDVAAALARLRAGDRTAAAELGEHFGKLWDKKPSTPKSLLEEYMDRFKTKIKRRKNLNKSDMRSELQIDLMTCVDRLSRNDVPAEGVEQFIRNEFDNSFRHLLRSNSFDILGPKNRGEGPAPPIKRTTVEPGSKDRRTKQLIGTIDSPEVAAVEKGASRYRTNEDDEPDPDRQQIIFEALAEAEKLIRFARSQYEKKVAAEFLISGGDIDCIVEAIPGTTRKQATDAIERLQKRRKAA